MARMSREEFDKKVSVMKETNERMKILHEIQTERAMYSNKEVKKHTKTSNIVLFASIIAIVVYTIAAMVIQYHTGTEISTTLSTLWYGFWTVEIVSLAGIKVTKVIKDYHSNNEDDNPGAMG